MHFLVYESVLRDDQQFQLAHAHRIVQVPDVWRQSDTNAYTDSDANRDPNTNSNSNTYTNTESNACPAAERSHESCWERSLDDSDQSVVD